MKRLLLLLQWLLVTGVSASSARAEGPSDRPVRAHGVELGLGNHFGGLGGSYTLRLDQRFAATVGVGVLDGHLTGAGGARCYPWGPLFAQIGASPMAYTADKVYYGPDAVLGVDLVRNRFAFTFDVGVGTISFREFFPSFDLGVGVNFGRGPERRFDRSARDSSLPQADKE